jgi:hypothetical protein
MGKHNISISNLRIVEIYFGCIRWTPFVVQQGNAQEIVDLIREGELAILLPSVHAVLQKKVRYVTAQGLRPGRSGF